MDEKFAQLSLRKRRNTSAMTHQELILGCLRLGLDGEKVDYEWMNEEKSVVLKFEDGKRMRLAIHEVDESTP
jgi:hypothetical protein